MTKTIKANQEDYFSSETMKEYVKIIANSTTSTHYRCFINKPIEDPHFYEDLTQVAISAGEDDCLEVLINSGGGRLDSCISIVNALRSSEAYTRSVITADAHSAASMIALSCDDCLALPNTAMLLHQPRGGDWGTHSERITYGEFNKAHIARFYKDVYKYFLTEKEIEYCLNGKDYWLDADEINRRVQKRNELRQKEAKRVESEKNKLVAAPKKKLDKLGKVNKIQE